MVKVEAERDCEPTIFLLTPQSTGEKRINVYIDQFGRNILTRAFQVKVVADLAACKRCRASRSTRSQWNRLCEARMRRRPIWSCG